ncbi:hypothetical protein ACFCZ4_08975 [Streptomyces microflavus]|uniref:hypothetical protein n=1 Tax=Streptomyces TaxID=1883 RepID=UPI000B916907|nr:MULTISPECIES: hypothetical protein [Streptomyces]MBK3585133.1 hypothetical protein [Streptomyces sp. MBT57]
MVLYTTEIDPVLRVDVDGLDDLLTQPPKHRAGEGLSVPSAGIIAEAAAKLNRIVHLDAGSARERVHRELHDEGCDSWTLCTGTKGRGGQWTTGGG